MKTKILAVCPYEALHELILDLASQRDDVEVVSIVGDVSEGQRLLERVEEALDGCDVIISRGSTMRAIQQNMQLPVIEIVNSGFDIMRIVRLLKDYTGKCALVGTRRTEEDARMICEMLGSHIDLFHVYDEESTHEQIQRLKEEEYKLIIGGVTATTAARSLGMNALLITSGKETVSAALDEAVRLHRLTTQMNLENQLFRDVINGENGYTVIFDSQQRLIYRSSKQPDIPTQSLVKKVNAILQFGDIFTHVRIGQKLYNLQGKLYSIDRMAYVLIRLTPCFYIEPGIQSWISVLHFAAGNRPYYSTLNGHSQCLSNLLSQIQAYAKSSHPVALYGEIGVGKADVVNQLHVISRKKANDLIVIDASEGNKKLWEMLFESPHSPLQQVGYSIYFKNMQDIPAYVRPSLEEYVRSMASIDSGRLYFSWATSSLSAIESDSFYRFLIEETGSLSLRVPSLRERIEDIPSLLSVIISECNIQLGKEVFGIEDGVLPLLQEHTWPYNFVQFRQVVRDAVMMSTYSHISVTSVQTLLNGISQTPCQATANTLNLNKTLDEINMDIIQYVLKEENYNYSRSAARLGISRSSLWRKTKQ